MKHSVKHSLSKDMATKVAHKAFASYVERFKEYNAKADWKNDEQADISFKAKGVSLKGNVQVTDQDIQVDMDVPFLLRPFKDLAISKIDEEINEWIGRAKRGELD